MSPIVMFLSVSTPNFIFSVGNNVRFVLLCARVYVPAFKPYKIHFPSYTFSIVIVKDAILVGSRFVAFTIFCNPSPCNVSMRACCLCVYVRASE